MDVVDRLFEFMAAQGLSQNKFEEMCGLTHTNLRKMKQGPTAAYLARIITTFPELSMDWLFRGEAGGPMLNERQRENENPTHLASHTNDIHNNVVIIGNWSEFGDVVEKAVSKAMSNK